MKRFCLYLVLVVAAWTFQASLARFPGSTLRFDFILLIVIYLGFVGNWRSTAWVVLLIGLATEALAAPRTGLLTVSYLTVFFGIQAAQTRFLFDGMAARTVWVMLLVLVQRLTITLLTGWRFEALVDSLGVAALESVTSLVFFPVLDRWEKVLGREA